MFNRSHSATGAINNTVVTLSKADANALTNDQ